MDIEVSVFDNFIATSKRFFKAFRQAYLTYDILDATNFDDYNARVLRYAILFAFYENTVYDQLRDWSIGYKTNYSLYRYIRNIYNPANRLTEFWRTVVWGGLLDTEAGEEGAIPIEGASSQLRNAISTVWEWSNMAMLKDLITLYGASMGDVGIKIVDSIEKQRTYLEVIHPSNIRDIIIDNRGHCQGYVLEFEVEDDFERMFPHVEVCEKLNSRDIAFTVYEDGKEIDYKVVPYGFVPFSMIRHNYVGGTYGWAEIHPHRPKIHELDEQASKLHDYIRKAIDPVWLFNFKKPKNAADLKGEATTASSDNPQPGREEIPALYVPDRGARAQALVTESIDLDQVGNRVKDMVSELERDLPELQMDIWTAGGYTTGKALKTARQRVEKKVLTRRPMYDDPLVNLHGMAVAIGGERSYPGYEGFNLSSYERGELKHFIPTERPVFDTDALEAVERKQIFWNIVYEAIDRGADLETVLIDLGWSEQKARDFISKLDVPPDEGTTPTQGEQDANSNPQTVDVVREAGRP